MLMKSFSNLKKTSYFHKQLIRSFAEAAPKKDAKENTNTSIGQRFHELYLVELDKIEKTSMDLLTPKYKIKEDAGRKEGYIHPYHSTKFPIYWSNYNLHNFMHEAVGPEPVSPHYESFTRSRRMPIMLMGMLYMFSMIDRINFASYYGLQAKYQLYTLTFFSIGIFEMRYILQKLPAPRLTWFYSSFIESEYKQLVSNFPDMLEENSRKLLSHSKEQLDYFLIHQEFVYIKKRSLSTYLESEKKNLEKHFYDRTVNMLKTIENLENSNIKGRIRQIADESMKSVFDKFTGSAADSDKIHKASFESALDGLRTGKMTYKSDPILPLFIEEAKKRLEPLMKLSKEEENKTFGLSDDQKRLVIDNDTRAKIEYLARPPDVASGGVKNTDVYRNIIVRMKKRIEANFRV